ncbi:hypothetical protein [Egbenema bharatensis]
MNAPDSYGLTAFGNVKRTPTLREHSSPPTPHSSLLTPHSYKTSRPK